MLKSNCKKVRERIQQYMLEQARNGLEGYLPQKAYKEFVTQQEIDDSPMTAVNRIFEQEKSWEIKHIGRPFAFIDWLRGLCSALPVYDGCYFRSRQRLQEWLEQTDAEAARYEDFDVDVEILHLYWREFNALLEKEQRELNGNKQQRKNG